MSHRMSNDKYLQSLKKKKKKKTGAGHLELASKHKALSCPLQLPALVCVCGLRTVRRCVGLFLGLLLNSINPPTSFYTSTIQIFITIFLPYIFKLQKLIAPDFFLLFKNILSILWFLFCLLFHTTLRIFLSRSVKICAKFLIRIVLSV